MKSVIIGTLVLALAACKVQKTGEDTYKVVVPTAQAKAAGQKAKEEAKQAADKLKKEAGELQQKTKTEKTETTSTHH